MKLIIQIPCFNEEQTLPTTLAELPKTIPGIDEIETLVIDDGSTDASAAVARELGVDHIVRLTRNQGLARAFVAGLEAALRLGADIIVNTDGDNQYRGADVPILVRPILKGVADIVIGDRRVMQVAHFSLLKKYLQVLGSWTVRRFSGIQIPDATSGFRALSRDAALRLYVISDFSYTLETIIQAGHRKLAVTSVPIGTNGKLRESRLFSSVWGYVRLSASTVLRVYSMYRPLQVFLVLGGMLFVPGLFAAIRFLYYYLHGRGTGHIQSLVLGAALMTLGCQTWILGVIGDLVATNRKLAEETLYRVRKIQFERPKE